MFHKFLNRYVVEGQLYATTAIHIGTAMDEFTPGGNKNPFFRNAQGLPMIPGSSLKGAMRSMLEQFLLSEIGVEVFGKSNKCSDANPCFDFNSDKYKTMLNEMTEKEIADFLVGEKGLCMTCRLFGSQGSSAKLYIRDAKVVEETFQNEFEVRSGNSIERDLGKSKKNHLYEIEVVPEGTVFSFCAILENAEEEEWNCLQMLLRAMETGFLTIGGMKSRGLGGVELREVKYQKIDDSNIKEFFTGQAIDFQLLEKSGGA